MPYTYEYPRPSVTVDCLIINLKDGALEVLLIKRKKDPYKGKWALPGGFLDMDENLKDAAARELKEETGFEHADFEQLGAFGDVDRDPRGRTISVGFYTILIDNQKNIKADDDAEDAAWIPLRKCKNLAFDHDLVIGEAGKKIVEKLRICIEDNQPLFDMSQEQIKLIVNILKNNI